jgi:hypothetical protein
VVVLLGALGIVACGGGGGDGPKAAGGKVFRQAEVKRCLKHERLLLASRRTETGIDFTAYWRDGKNRADFGVELTPEGAATRLDAWEKLAKQANVENPRAYYARYGNVVVGYQRLPTRADRALLERCLT